jgi:hypothetical protein
LVKSHRVRMLEVRSESLLSQPTLIRFLSSRDTL